MRLWHQSLISKLPRQQLLGLHRECAALRGKGWGRNHSVVNYVFTHDPEYLVAYHYLVMDEMKRRGYNPDEVWRNPNWRGTALGEDSSWVGEEYVSRIYNNAKILNKIIYPEHDSDYYQVCVDNLKSKGIDIGGN